MGQFVQITESTVEVDGIKVHYCRAGQGPALVMVHGLVGSAHNWDQNIEEFARFRTVYALDLVNMGESERVVGLDAGLEATADRIARCMDALQIESADIAGHSHGGAISMMLAARHPQRVRKLVLFAPANPYCDLGYGLIHFYNTRVGGWLARRIPQMPRAVHDLAHRRMYGDKNRVQAGALDGYTRSLNRESVEHVLGIVRRWADDMTLLRNRLVEVAGRPTLIIWGDRDRAVGLASGQHLAKKLGARLMVIPGVGHLPFAETPQLCNEAIGRWLQV